MSNQDQKKTMQVPTFGVHADHMRQTYAFTSSRRGWKSFPMGQAAKPRNETVLQSFNLAKYKLSLDKKFTLKLQLKFNVHKNNITI